MEKIVLKLKSPESVKFDFFGNEIQVRPLMTLSEQILYINSYIDQYFFPGNANIDHCAYDYIGAEFALAATIIDNFTNIRVLSEKSEVLIDADDLYSRGLWEEVTERIINWSSFRANLDRVVSDMKEQEAQQKAIGFVIDDLVENAKQFMKGVSELDEEQIKAMKETFLSLVSEVKNSPLSGLMEESQRQPKTKRKKAA